MVGRRVAPTESNSSMYARVGKRVRALRSKGCGVYPIVDITRPAPLCMMRLVIENMENKKPKDAKEEELSMKEIVDGE